MSWVTNIFWGSTPHQELRTTPVEDFNAIVDPLDPQLLTSLQNFLPTQKSAAEKLKNVISLYYPLAFVSDLGESKGAKVCQVKDNKSGETKILRILNVEQFPKGNVTLSNTSTGVEWMIFSPTGHPFPQAETAIVQNQSTKEFEILTQAEILDHLKGEKTLSHSYTLYGTLSPHLSSPIYIDALLDPTIATTITRYIPGTRPNLFLFFLGHTFKNFNIIKPLGSGSFAQVWQVKFTDLHGKNETMALRLVPTDSSRVSPGDREKYYEISPSRFGGEFAALLPESPYTLSSFFAIVWDAKKETFRLMGREEVKKYKDQPQSLENNRFTLYGTLSECHEGAEDLAQKLKREKKLPLDTVKNYAFQLLLGIKDLPEGMIHRDLKPANILETKEGFLKILDFGFSRTDVSPERMAESFLGTPYYMPPEVMLGKQYDQKADLYSLGVLLFELLTGEPLFPAKTFLELEGKVKKALEVSSDPKDDPRLQNFSEDARNFISHLCHPKVEMRWDLTKILNEDPFLGGYTLPREDGTPIPDLLPHSSSTPSSLAGRVGKLLFLAGGAFVLYYLARRILILSSRPHFPKGKPLSVSQSS